MAQLEDAGPVGVGVGVALVEVDSLANGVVIEATDWPPHAVVEMTKATAAAAEATRR